VGLVFGVDRREDMPKLYDMKGSMLNELLGPDVRLLIEKLDDDDDAFIYLHLLHMPCKNATRII
jgi:hypothetical protein